MSPNFQCVLGRMAIAILFLFSTEQAFATGTDSTKSPHSSESNLVLHLSGGLGFSPANIGSSLWAIEAMAGQPVFGNDFLWIGFTPTIVPKFHLQENVGDGFLPIALEYDHPLSRSWHEPAFVYGMLCAGPQFGDHSDRAFFHTWMASAGIGMKDGGTAGFIGKFGLDYTTIRTGSAGFFVVLNSGIYF
jgi:hypothetical protein